MDKRIYHKIEEQAIADTAEETNVYGPKVREVVEAYIQNLSERGRAHLARQLTYAGHKPDSWKS